MNSTNTIIIFLGCIMGILLFGKMLILPIKITIKLILNSILGGLIIALINWIGTTFNLHIGLNIFTAIFVRNSWNSRSDTTYNIQIVSVIKQLIIPFILKILKNSNKNSIIKDS